MFGILIMVLFWGVLANFKVTWLDFQKYEWKKGAILVH
jgi:hypothetical protein